MSNSVHLMTGDIDPKRSRLPDILIVEDDDADAKAILRAVRKNGLSNRIFRAVDGIEALDFLKSLPANTMYKVIVLSDINMPRMNGHELLEALRADETLSRVVVFIMTTSTDPEDISVAYDNNAAGYITKQSAGEDLSGLMTLLQSYSSVVELPDLKSSGRA